MEKFPFLFFVHTAPGVQLWFWLCQNLKALPRPDRRALKQQLIRALLLTQAEEREGYSSHNSNAGRACSGRGWHDIAIA